MNDIHDLEKIDLKIAITRRKKYNPYKVYLHKKCLSRTCMHSTFRGSEALRHGEVRTKLGVGKIKEALMIGGHPGSGTNRE
jgi:hypothetical protein